MNFTIDSDVRIKFEGLKVLLAEILYVKVEKHSPYLDELRSNIKAEVLKKYSLETLKDEPIFRVYRNFFWRAGIDPTKTRPAAEALIRRILSGGDIPMINNVVDAYNLASVKTEIALAAFDMDRLNGDIVMRFAKRGEHFLGIGMKKPIELNGGEIVISDEKKLIAIYPYRDADVSKVSEETKNVLIMSCGAPGLDDDKLNLAAETSIRYVTKYCGGKGRILQLVT